MYLKKMIIINLKLFQWNSVICILPLLHLLHPAFANKPENVTKKISQFRKLSLDKIYPNSSFVHKSIQDDLYSLKWLMANNLDVNRAHKMFMDHLAWRSKEKIDTIHSEDWSFFADEYPHFCDSTDNFGRPITELWYSEWNIRRAVVSGLGKKLVRWTMKLVETAQRKLYEARRVSAGKTSNMTGVVELVDLAGFNNWQHMCPSCISNFLKVEHLVEQNYPYIFDQIYMLNVGPIFRSFMASVKNQSSFGKRAKLELYSEKRKWAPVLDKFIAKDQRSIRFGGNCDRST